MQPKALVLNLLRVHGDVLEVGQLLRAGEVFGVEPGTVRVALCRLASAGLVEQAGRGRWTMAVAAAPLAGQVDGWRILEERGRLWDGGFVGVATGGEGGGRAGERQRRRALDLLGFRTFRPGLEIRPDNLRNCVREGLRALSVSSPVFALRNLGPDQDAAERLWDVTSLEAGYADRRCAIARATERIPTLTLPEAARLTWVVGGEAIRTLALDPVLPEQLVDVEARRALGKEMRAFDLVGRKVWRRLLDIEEVPG